MSAVPVSATAGVRQAARRLDQSGVRVFQLGAGEPQTPSPAEVVAAAGRAAADPRLHRYAPGQGIPDLRDAVADYRADLYGHALSPDAVLVTCGAKQAVFNTLLALVDPGDEVIVPTPCWVSYPTMAQLAGGVPVAVPTTAEEGFTPRVQQLEAARTPRTKVLVLNSPGNPTGAVYPADELRRIGRWALTHGIWVISDEVYGELLEKGSEPLSVVTAVPELSEQCAVVHGVSKTFAMTGWRVGWLIGPARLIKAATALQSHSTSHPTAVAQQAAAAALTDARDAAERMRADYQRRRQLVVERLSGVPGVTLAAPRGAFYAFPRFAPGGRPLDDEEFATRLLREHHVATVPGAAFGAPSHLRISCTADDDELLEGLDRLLRALP
ncbi:pyridoxal phosphate-dependent aminotransferase [Streptomyces sp. NPDC004647]|uniref:pyridoxal phosphate-dependent aminotransferase n=1 Tax=Streptomyces sp. NPDC004647 TaxID=3154671 RepID=UPI0033AF94A2